MCPTKTKNTQTQTQHSHGESRPAAKKTAGFDTPVRFLCLKNLADMLEREGDVARALELQVAAAEEDQTDLAVRSGKQRGRAS